METPPSFHHRTISNIDDVMNYVLAHKNFASVFFGRDRAEYADELTTTLPTLDGLETFGVSSEESESLWRLEAERLVDAVNNADNGDLPQELGIPDGDYHLLVSLAKTISPLLSICRVDNEVTMMERAPEMHDQEMFQLNLENLRKIASPATFKGKDVEEISESLKGIPKKMTKDEWQRCIFVFIDYFTLVLARILVGSATHNSTYSHICLACLAKFATKLKFISSGSDNFAGTALSHAENAAKRYRHLRKHPDNGATGTTSGPPRTSFRRMFDNGPDDILQNVYYGQNMAVHKRLDTFSRSVLNGLQSPKLIGTTRAIFDVCNVVYGTGLRRFPTWVYKSSDGSFQATACPTRVSKAWPAFQLLQSTAVALEKQQELRQRQRPPPGTNSNAPTRNQVGQFLQWDDISGGAIETSALPNGYSPSHRVEIRTLAEAVTIMVPILLVTPFVLSELPSLFNDVTFADSDFNEDGTPSLSPETRWFKAFFSVSAESHMQIEVKNGIRFQNASSLSKGLMTRDRLLRITQTTDIYGRLSSQREDIQSRLDFAQGMHRAIWEMEAWLFEENAVLVSCKFYVWTTMALAIFLVVGGVIIGFTVRGRIEAVDPFNITTYCWVLAAFCVLMAKSARFENWPWHEFLRGHFRCRSVTELHSVTRIPEQLILCKLLDTEDTNILKTRGPYNTAFGRKSDGDGGFTIDRPLSMWAMLLSGLIMIKVITDHGPTLVCLEVRRGTTYVSVGSMYSSRGETEKLVCTNLTRPVMMLPLKRQAIDWHRVVGLYVDNAAMFI